MKRILFSLLFLISSTAHAGTISFDQVATSADITVSKYNTDLDRIYSEFNSTVETTNVANDTLTEDDMADDINPRIRTFEGAACEKVDDGLLPGTTSGTLSGSVPAGTAYPRGFRCDKTSSTAKTFTASKWTYVDIDQNCDFQYTEVAIDASTPAVATNSIRLARVSSDATEVNDVKDLRTTSCASGPFSAISDTSTGATLADLFVNGSPVKISDSYGWIQGLQVSWDTHTQFQVKRGSAHINAKYRFVSTDVTVPTTNDDPSQGTSGLDTGAIAASTRYYVYAVADQDDVASLSISYSANNGSPTGLTNFRKIGSLITDANSLFTSEDIVLYHSVSVASNQEIDGWCSFDGTSGSMACDDHYNVSSMTDNGTGDYTITWDTDFTTAGYAFVCTTEHEGTDNEGGCLISDGGQAVGSVRIVIHNNSSGARDSDNVGAMAIGTQ